MMSSISGISPSRFVPQSVPARRQRWWLIVSLGVNLLLAGLILSWVVDAPPHTPPLIVWQRELVPDLTPADAMIVKEAIERFSEAQQQGMTAIHEDLGQVGVLLAREPLDQSALQAVLDDMAARRNNQQAAVNQALFKELTEVSADGRAKVIAALKREAQRWRPPSPAH